MHIGGMRHRVKFLKPVAERNDINEAVTTFKKWRTVWASILPDDGRVMYRAKQENNEIEGMIETRYMEGITSKMRIELRDRQFQIIYARCPQELKHKLRIAYKEVV